MATYKNVKDFLKKNYDVSNVLKGVDFYTRLLVSKCQGLFYYENLPDTLNSWEIEKNLILKGNGAIVEKKGGLYIPFTGTVYGYDEYDVPDRFTFSQPILGGGSYLDGQKCAIVWNTHYDKLDYTQSLLFSIIKRYARVLADIDSTIHSQLVGGRLGRMGMAQNSQVGQAVDEVMTKLALGDVSTIVNSQMLVDNFKPLQFNNVEFIAELTRTRDYMLNCFYNEIGINTLEEKKERMITDEITNDNRLLMANIDEMYSMRVANVDKINQVFGTNIVVKKSKQLASMEV